MQADLAGGATHYLLAHLSVKADSWVLRREFSISPGFRPSQNTLHYTDLDGASRAAVREHLQNINGGDMNDMVNVLWALDSCWRLSDMDEWFSFAIVLVCLPVARALKNGGVIVPDPKPRVLYHLTAVDAIKTSYNLEYNMPVSSGFNSSTMAASSSSSSYAPTLAVNYDNLDPGGRRAVQLIIDRANQELLIYCIDLGVYTLSAV